MAVSDGNSISTNFAKAEIVDMRVKSIQEEHVVTMDVSLEVDNPNDQPLRLVDIEFLVEDLNSSIDLPGSTQDHSDNPVITKNIQKSCLIKPQTSEVIKIPLQFAYKNLKPDSNGAPSETGNAGKIIPFTIHGRLNCFEAIRGMFVIAISKLKKFLTIASHKLGTGNLRGFVPPTGMINGSHFVSITPDQLQLKFEARVRNGNPVPIQLLYTNVSMEVDSKVLDARVNHNITLSARSSRKVTVPYAVSLKDHFGDKPGTVVPYKLKLEFWFKENFHGMYKVLTEKAGELPVPAKSTAKIQSAAFNVDEQGQPLAKVCVKLENKNSFPIKVTKLRCDIVRKSDGVCAAVAEDGFVETDRAMEIAAGESGSIWMAATSGSSEDAFGSALWDAFTGETSRFSVIASVESETKFGKMTT